MRDIRRWIPGAILMAGSLLLLRARTQEAVPLRAPLTTVLSDVTGYEWSDQTITDDEVRVAGMSAYVARAYQRDSALAFTTLVSYYDRQTQGKTIHSPRNCLPGAGWEIVEAGRQVVQVEGVPRELNRYILKNGTATALAYYWYQGRGRVTASEYAVKWNLLRDAALHGRSEEALVRIVVPIGSGAGVGGGGATGGALHHADSTAQRIAARMIRDVAHVLPTTGS